MDILEVTHRYPPALGGVEIQVEAIAAGLVDRGHSVQVVTTDVLRDHPFRRLPPGRYDDHVPVRRHRATRLFPAPHGLGIAAPGMGSDLLRSRADVVHAHAFGMAPTWMAAAARRVRSTPLVVETHFDPGRGTAGWRAYAGIVARGTLTPADRVVAHTEVERRLLTSIGVAPDKIARIPNGIDLAEFPPRERSPRRDAPFRVLFVGRLLPERKGLEPLVRAMARLPAGRSRELRLVGEDWGARGIVAALARELGVDGRITMTGPLARSDVLKEYATADLFVLPSLYECTPIALMEAMAAGLPIVTTRVGGIPEVVSEGTNALLCPPDDPSSLTDAIERLEADESLRSRFSRSGPEDVLRFSWDRVIPQWIRLFEELCAPRR
jgi:glycosyltransferase involved in cell wall biosynthesis